jgi:zinc protease
MPHAASFSIRRALALLACFAIAISLGNGSPTEAAGVSESTVTKATLANGLRVVVVRNPLAPVVSTDMAYEVGSRDDPADVPGMAHAQEHMMFRGTKNLSTAELGTLATALGGNFNAETSETLTQFEFTVPSSDLDAVLRIESDRMRDVLDLQSEWETERGAIEQEVLADETRPGADLFRDAEALALAGTTYAHDGVGTRAAFDKLTGERLKAFWNTWYAPNNAVFVIAGDVDPQKVIADIRARFESIPKKNVPAHPVAHFQPVKRTFFRRPSSLVYPLAVVGYRMPGVGDDDFLPSYLLQLVLDSPRGPLHNLVDTGEALDGTWDSLPYVPGAQVGFATAALRPGADPSAMTEHLEAIVHEYAVQGVPKELFETTKRHAIADQELSRNSISSLANDWATTIALDDEPSIEREQQLLAGVTLADVDRVAKKYFDPAHAIIGALTPSATASQASAPEPPAERSEKPLAVQPPVTHLPDWANALVGNVVVPADRPAPEATRLPDGIRLVIEPETISDSVFVFGNVRTNRFLQEPAGQEGVSSLLGTIFEYGSQNRDRPAFVRAQDDLDSELSTGPRFAVQTTSKSFARALDLLAEGELHPRFDDATFAAARARTLEELETSLGGTASAIQRATAARLLPAGDPELREPTVASLQSLTLADVRDYYAKTFRPDLATIVVIGNVDVPAARTAIERAFGAWTATGTPPSLDLGRVPQNAAGEYRLTPPAARQDTGSLEELLETDRGDPAYYALELGNAILGGGSGGPEQSRLFRDIRQNAGLAYSIGSELAVDRTRARFEISYACLPSNEQRIATLASEDVEKMRTDPPGTFELALAKASIVRRSIVDEGSVTQVGSELLGAASGSMPLDQSRIDARALVATSGTAVRDAMAKYIHTDHFVHVVVGP